MTELEGAVFTDEAGHTLYTWPQHLLRNGYSGEQKGRIECYDIVRTKTAGLMSPYPPGVLLPELDTRPSCTDLWRPVLVLEGAEPIGKWSIVEGQDGRRQWAYDEQPVYTSHLDQEPGDTTGGTKRRYGGEGAAARNPIGPPPRVPPAFRVMTTAHGGLVMTRDARSVYILNGESEGQIRCTGDCLDSWQPLTAPALARGDGLFSLVERSPGVRQWAFRGQPLYTYSLDSGEDWMVGSDVSGWSNVYLWETPEPPEEFTAQDTIAGQVLADAQGRTIYLYSCGDDSIDQLGCDHPTDPQVYRLAICGRGDPEVCQENWHYVPAKDDAESGSRAWRAVWIDPMTGRFSDAGVEGAMRVWAYRDRPVYTYFLDEKPGDVRGDATGEWRGGRNGLKAYWIRNAYFRGQ
ncbi:hypothetical protein HK107_07410 [Parvularcula sp. ZS-1/3]|uniref:Uncharacterized protein n=2 Tax=Parvularcula mediterranea TaxID=2732508 RepID=A0A7Y3W5D2_9PROT|nr:hypothetical protein [Parvularcula mediterranea]